MWFIRYLCTYFLRVNEERMMMRKFISALLTVGLILFFTTPVLASDLGIIYYNPIISLVFGGGLLVLGRIGNRRFLKR